MRREVMTLLNTPCPLCGKTRAELQKLEAHIQQSTFEQAKLQRCLLAIREAQASFQ